MEVRLVLSKEAADYVRKLAVERNTSAGNAINRLLVEVVRIGGLPITDHVKPDVEDKPPM